MTSTQTSAVILPLRQLSLPGLADSSSPDQLRAALHSQSAAAGEQSQLVLAENITAHAVTAYWKSLGSGLTLAPAPTATHLQLEVMRETAERFGQSLAGLPAAEASQQLGSLYTSLLPPERRSQRGIFYTPPALAAHLLNQAEAAGVDWAHAHVIDPAAGAGAFLIPAARRMLDALSDCTPAVALQNLSARLRGYEIEPFSAWMAQVFVEAEALPVVLKSGRRLSPIVSVCNSLEVKAEGVFDLVIGNPPFGRQPLPPKLRARFSRSLFGHANLYGLFMDLAIRLARPEGLVSLLTPSSFLAGEYFKNLRALLWNEAPPLCLDFVSARKGVFENVLQETVLATYRKGARRSSAGVSVISSVAGQTVLARSVGTFSLPEEASAPWLVARHADDARLARKLRSMPSRLADWGYKVSTGPLVWNRYKSQLVDVAEGETVPVIWAESVTSDGRFHLRYEKRNHKPFLRLQLNDDWLLVRRPCVLLQRTTAKEQARRLIAAQMPAALLKQHGAVSVENHLNMMIPIVSNPVVSPKLLASFLNSDAADRAFRCLSGSVAVSAYELENLPLPTAAELIEKTGSQISAENVAKACAQLYQIEGLA